MAWCLIHFATQHSNQGGNEAIGLITESNMGKGGKEIKVREGKRKGDMKEIIVVGFQRFFFFISTKILFLISSAAWPYKKLGCLCYLTESCDRVGSTPS
jgi:hypothetical protein